MYWPRIQSFERARESLIARQASLIFRLSVRSFEM
jgi:hypothetical protein